MRPGFTSRGRPKRLLAYLFAGVFVLAVTCLIEALSFVSELRRNPNVDRLADSATSTAPQTIGDVALSLLPHEFDRYSLVEPTPIPGGIKVHYVNRSSMWPTFRVEVIQIEQPIGRNPRGFLAIPVGDHSGWILESREQKIVAWQSQRWEFVLVSPNAPYAINAASSFATKIAEYADQQASIRSSSQPPSPAAGDEQNRTNDH